MKKNIENDKKTQDIVTDFFKEYNIKQPTTGAWQFIFPEKNSPKNYCEFSLSVYVGNCAYCNGSFYSMDKSRICKECLPQHIENFKKQQRSELKPKFDKIVEQYVNHFCEKQDLEFNFWIADDIGGAAYFNSVYTLYFDDIRFDIDNEISKGKIIEYSTLPPESPINYKNYCKLNP